MVEGQGFEPWPHVVGEVLLEAICHYSTI